MSLLLFHGERLVERLGEQGQRLFGRPRLAVSPIDQGEAAAGQKDAEHPKGAVIGGELRRNDEPEIFSDHSTHCGRAHRNRVDHAAHAVGDRYRALGGPYQPPPRQGQYGANESGIQGQLLEPERLLLFKACERRNHAERRERPSTLLGRGKTVQARSRRGVGRGDAKV